MTFFQKTLVGLLIPDDKIVRDADPSVVQSQRLLLAVWMTAAVPHNLMLALFLLFLLGIDADPNPVPAGAEPPPIGQSDKVRSGGKKFSGILDNPGDCPYLWGGGR